MSDEPVYSLAELGWSTHFQDQLDHAEPRISVPARITSVHRDRVNALTAQGPATPGLPTGLLAGEIAIGDWVLHDPIAGQVRKLLARKSLISRRAAGADVRDQLIAANVDTLFITTSANADFNPARLERYLALAHAGGVAPVIVLTKSDLCDATGAFLAQLSDIAPAIPTLALDARAPDAAAALTQWNGPGTTAAFLGSSGVGKSTLIAALTGQDVATAAIRELDAKGRHTTTARAMYRTKAGGWVIDTPGMRALRLHDVRAGIDTVFADLAALAATCRFNDCAHESEPGCAVRAAIEAGKVDADRLARWRKLRVEDARNAESLAQSRKRAKSFSKSIKSAKARKSERRGK